MMFFHKEDRSYSPWSHTPTLAGGDPPRGDQYLHTYRPGLWHTNIMMCQQPQIWSFPTNLISESTCLCFLNERERIRGIVADMVGGRTFSSSHPLHPLTISNKSVVFWAVWLVAPALLLLFRCEVYLVWPSLCAGCLLLYARLKVKTHKGMMRLTVSMLSHSPSKAVFHVTCDARVLFLCTCLDVP